MPEVRDHRKPGWFWMDNRILDDYGERLGVYGIAVYALLAKHASEQDQRAWPSLRTMAKELHIGLSSLQRSLDQLVTLGLVSREHRKTEAGDYTSNVYALLAVPEPEAEGVSEENRRVPGGGTPVPGENIRVYPEEVHRVPGENTEQDLINKTQIQPEER